jgi:hypothetical protein
MGGPVRHYRFAPAATDGAGGSKVSLLLEDPKHRYVVPVADFICEPSVRRFPKDVRHGSGPRLGACRNLSRAVVKSIVWSHANGYNLVGGISIDVEI